MTVSVTSRVGVAAASEAVAMLWVLGSVRLGCSVVCTIVTAFVATLEGPVAGLPVGPTLGVPAGATLGELVGPTLGVPEGITLVTSVGPTGRVPIGPTLREPVGPTLVAPRVTPVGTTPVAPAEPVLGAPEGPTPAALVLRMPDATVRLKLGALVVSMPAVPVMLVLGASEGPAPGPPEGPIVRVPVEPEAVGLVGASEGAATELTVEAPVDPTVVALSP